MKVKLCLNGLGLQIPKTGIGAGIAFVLVWVDGNGFESASNSIGAIGGIMLETWEIDIGEVPQDKQSLFDNLHAQVVKYDITPNIFAKDGGIACIAMTIYVQQDGGLAEQKIEFRAENCRGVSLLSNAISFSCEMLQMEKPVAIADGGSVLSDEEIAMACDDAQNKSGQDADTDADTTSSAAA